MDYLDKVLARANTYNIKEFLLYGVEPIKPREKSYEENINIEFNKIAENINKKYNNLEKEELINLILMHNSMLEEIYFELGLKCGIKLKQSISDKL